MWALWRNNVATLLRHHFFHMIRCAYIVCMFPPNLKQIGQKTWLQEPKNRQNGRYDVITSRRCYVMTFFTHGTMRLYRAHVSTKFEANRSKNMAKGPKKPPKMTFLRHNVATLLRHDVFFTWCDAPMPYACFHQIWSKSVKKCAHSGQNKFSRRHDVMTSRRHENFRPPTPPAQVISMLCPSLKKIRWVTTENIKL